MDYNKHFEYNPNTGLLCWRVRDRSCFMSDWHYNEHLKFAGKRLGSTMRSRSGKALAVVVNVRKQGLKDTLYHRIAWQMVNGPIPEGFIIDHINGNPEDNRLANLRLCTQYGNMRNTRRHSGCGHGVKGVSWDKHNKKWQTEIRTDVGRIFLGRHATKGLAAVAYAKASIRYHGEYSHILSRQ